MATDKTDDLLISVSTDLSVVKRQLKQLTADIGQTASGVQKQFDAMGKGIDQSLTPIQKRINAMVGLPVGPKLKEWQGALAGVEGSSKLTANQLLNLSRQGNDVVTMFALGAKPMQIFASQAGQVFDALQSGPAGAMGSIKAIGEGAISLATKFPLVTAAIAAAGVAVVAYEASGIGSFKSLDEIIKTHEANIKRLGDAYDKVAGKQHNYAADTARTVNALNKQGAQDAADLLKRQTLDVLGKLDANLASFDERGRFAAFGAPIKELMSELKNGTPDIKQFRDQINAIADANPGLDGKRKEILDFSQSAADTAAQLPNLNRAVSDVSDTVNQFGLQLANVDSKPLQAALQELFDKARDGKEPIDQILESLARLEQANPTFAGILAGFQGLLTAASQTAAALDNLGARYFANQGTPTNGRQKLPVGLLPDTAPVPDFAPNREDLGAAYDKAQAKAARASRFHAPAKTADDRFFEDIEAIRQRTMALAQEQSMLGQSFEAQQKRKVAFDLETTALKQVREEARKKGDVDWQNAQLSPEQVAQIDAVSEAYARQADALRKAQEMYDLQKDIIKGAFDDLRSALEDGKLDWQDFGKIANDVLDKIIDKIENDLVDAIMQASGSGGGSFGSILGFLTGSGGGGGSDPGIISALGLRANGGPVTAGKPYIVGEKRAELFVPNVSGTIVPRVPTMPSINGGGGGSQTFAPVVTFAPTIQMQGNGDAGEQVTAALKKFEKEFTPRVVKSLREAKTRGMV
ncbi:MAG: hypothetical protein E5X72_14250 [Mesorhizobium sp.]|uniref:phage tail length tape measure family protein n=1 Tax=Mesorhizobium sp. TaxID=1871066 RepID=UPI00120D82EE|nr:phage tail length tape measure family protein [Mesorhizobium sp.]TIP03862.1 MAG: hypothetical protein E5X72_14250 [Mesorhizobium sp.]